MRELQREIIAEMGVSPEIDPAVEIITDMRGGRR